MKHKHNAGYSLVETVVAIAILAIIVTPISTGMVLAFKMNAKTEQLMQAELAVSSAVETLMAEGITEASDTYGSEDTRFNKVKISKTMATEGEGTDKVDLPYYIVEVCDTEERLTVKTHIRAVEPTEPEGGDSE